MKKHLVSAMILVLFLLVFRPIPLFLVSSHNSKMIKLTLDNNLSVQLPQSAKVP